MSSLWLSVFYKDFTTKCTKESQRPQSETQNLHSIVFVLKLISGPWFDLLQEAVQGPEIFQSGSILKSAVQIETGQPGM